MFVICSNRPFILFQFRQYVLDRLIKVFLFYWLAKKVLIYFGLLEPLIDYINGFGGKN